jgi:hypothetical protein
LQTFATKRTFPSLTVVLIPRSTHPTYCSVLSPWICTFFWLPWCLALVQRMVYIGIEKLGYKMAGIQLKALMVLIMVSTHGPGISVRQIKNWSGSFKSHSHRGCV